MATWKLSRLGTGELLLEYFRPGSLGVFKAGTLTAATPRALVVSWVVDQPATQPGDLLVLPEGDVLHVLAQPKEVV